MIFKLEVKDAARHSSEAEDYAAKLPARRFFDPMANAIIEQRRDLLWSRQNAPRVAQILRAASHRPEGLFRLGNAYLRLRVILRRLETSMGSDFTLEQQDEIAQALWDLAILLEDGDIGDALERLRQAQERLSEAMRNGASDQEIAELMQELRRASEEYMQQLSRQAQENGDVMDDQNLPPNTMQMTQSDLQKMMDRIQELMEQGRMAEGRTGPARAARDDGKHAHYQRAGSKRPIRRRTGDGRSGRNIARTTRIVRSGIPRLAGTIQP